jgi:hypothetical protein
VCVMKPKSFTLTFKCLFSEAGFGELTVYDFWFVKSPSCDLALVFHISDETESVTLTFKR